MIIVQGYNTKFTTTPYLLIKYWKFRICPHRNKNVTLKFSFRKSEKPKNVIYMMFVISSSIHSKI